MTFQDDQLSPGYNQFDEERFVTELPKRHGRRAFARDKARVLHSAGLRRLAAKTQMMSAGADDFPRTRLTHTLEVAQIGRELGEALGCDPDLVETACLVHDLGHPPFGHNGEEALHKASLDIGGFEGNAQTFRLLTRLESKTIRDGRSLGLNLTRATLDAATKYPWGFDGKNPKFGYYQEDKEIFDWVRLEVKSQGKVFEAQVMDIADDIAYSVHDIEDAIYGKHFSPLALDSEPEFIEGDLGDLIINPKYNRFNKLPDLEKQLNHYKLQNKKCLVIGSGGASRAIIYSLISQKVRKIFIANRDQEKALKLIADFKNFSQQNLVELEFVPLKTKFDFLNEIDLIINGTSLGMVNQQKLDIDISNAKKTAIVYDIVYKPLITDLLRQAKELDLQIITGIGMLIEQALIGFEAWFKTKAKFDLELEKILLKNC